MLGHVMSLAFVSSLIGENATITGISPQNLADINAINFNQTPKDPWLEQVLNMERNLTPEKRAELMAEEFDYYGPGDTDELDNWWAEPVYPPFLPPQPQPPSTITTNRTFGGKILHAFGTGIELAVNTADDLLVKPINTLGGAVLNPVNKVVGGVVVQPIKTVGGGLFGLIKPKKQKTDPPTTTTTTTTTTTVKPPLNCEDHQVEFSGKCHTLLGKGPCPENHWLVEGPDGLGKCEPTPCEPPLVSLGGTCTHPKSTHLCHPGMEVVVQRTGEVECDCQRAHIFHQPNGLCYHAFRRGPCPEGEHFTLGKNTTKNGSPTLLGIIANPFDIRSGWSSKKALARAQELEDLVGVCVSNPCEHDGLVCYASHCSARNKNCVKLGSICGGGTGIFEVDGDTFRVVCNYGTDGRDFGKVPQFKCAPGSRRNSFGKCVKPVQIDL